MTTDTLQVSVVIPYHNRIDSLIATLQALRQQTLSPSRFEVIVVDDGSTDADVDQVTSLDPPFVLCIVKQGNLGPGAARNRGAARARGDLLVFLDADMIPERKLLEHYSASYAGCPAALFIGRQLPWPQAFTSPFDQAFNYVSVRDPGSEPGPAPFYYMASGNFALSAQLFERLGGFDERLRMTEDTDLAYRAHLRGIDVYYLPSAVGYHNHPKMLEDLCRNTRDSAWWTAQLLAKHPSLSGQLPIYCDIQPIRRSHDPSHLILRKAARRLLAQPISLSVVKAIVRGLERIAPHPRLLRFFYWKILGCYRFRGFHEGLAQTHHFDWRSSAGPRFERHIPVEQ